VPQGEGVSYAKREGFCAVWDTSFGGGQRLLTMVKRAKRRIVMGHRIGWPREGVSQLKQRTILIPLLPLIYSATFSSVRPNPFVKGSVQEAKVIPVTRRRYVKNF
jgi:hypothetical protein